MTIELSAVQQHVDAARVLEIEQALLRIPSSAFQEQQIADHLAERMTDIGLDVSMMDVALAAIPRSSADSRWASCAAPAADPA